MLAIITGIPGTGKTTVAKRALEKLDSEGINYRLITYGDVMVEIAKSQGLVESRDEMRKLKPEEQRDIQEKAAEKISEMSKEDNILVDTHCTIKTPKGYLPGVPESVIRRLNPDYFIIIEAKPEEIAQRRQYDSSRDRDTEIKDEIRFHQEINREIAATCSLLTGSTLQIVQNSQGKIEEAAEEIAAVLRG